MHKKGQNWHNNRDQSEYRLLKVKSKSYLNPIFAQIVEKHPAMTLRITLSNPDELVPEAVTRSGVFEA